MHTRMLCALWLKQIMELIKEKEAPVEMKELRKVKYLVTH